MKPAPRDLNLLHIRLAGQWDDGLELRAADSAHGHRLHLFDVLKMFRYNRRPSVKSKRLKEKSNIARKDVRVRLNLQNVKVRCDRFSLK